MSDMLQLVGRLNFFDLLQIRIDKLKSLLQK